MTQSIVGAIVALLGFRMLWAAVRRRTLAEAWIGLFFAASALGSETGLRAFDPTLDPELAVRLLFIGIPALTVSSLSAYAFTYTVFRRGERWARGVVLAGVLLSAWGAWHQLHGPNGVADISHLQVEFLLGRFACFAWGTYEALRAYGMARRRRALGLADPVVVNRFLLFGIWFGLMGVMPLTLAWARFTAGTAGQMAAAGIGPKIIGMVMIVALVLTFFPPRKYVSWVLASANEARS